MAIDRAKFAKDFFFELMKDSQRLRAGYLSERERWLRSLAVDGREEVLFEFEMLLRGIERYFNLHNLPIEQDATIVSRDFMPELKAVRDAISRALKLARFLLDPPSDRRLMFRKYLESKIADDRVRRELIEAELEQSTPQESLFLIRSGFAGLRGVLDNLQKLEACNYELFANVGQLALREIALNKYFKPFRPLEFRTEYDRIKNVRVLETVVRLGDGIRKPVSIGFLGLFRLLHYLHYVSREGEAPTRRSLVILALVRSEAGGIASYLEGDLAARLATLGTDKSARSMSIAQELKRETARIVATHNPKMTESPGQAIGKSREEFIAAIQHAIAQLAQVFDSSIEEKMLFDAAATRRAQSLRLRIDLYAFREICRHAEKVLAGPVDAVENAKVVGPLKAYVGYFRDVSYQLLRYGDFEPFDKFTAIVTETHVVPTGPAQRLRLAEDCRLFTDVLDRTFMAVSKREDLVALPFDAREGQKLAERFIRAEEPSAERRA